MLLQLLLCIINQSTPVNSDVDWLSFFGNLLGAAIGAVVSIIIFILASKSEKKKLLRSESKRIEHAKRTYFLQLKNALSAIKKQKDSYDEFISDSESTALDNALPNELIHEELKRLVLTPTNIILEIFDVANLTNDDYVILINSLDYLVVLMSSIADDMINNKKDSNERLINKFIEKRNELLEQSADFILSEKRLDPTGYLSRPITKFINDLISEYYRNDPGEIIDIKYDYENLVKPLRDNLLDVYQLEDISNHLLKKVKVLANIKFTLSEHNKGYAKDLKVANDQIKISIEKIEKIIAKMS